MDDDARTGPIVGPSPARRRRWPFLLVVAGLAAVAIAVAVAVLVGPSDSTATAARPAPAESTTPTAAAATPAPTAPGPATVDTRGRALPAAVVAGAGRVQAALRAGDLAALRAAYTPDTAAGVVRWPGIAPQLADAGLRADLAAALQNPPEPRPEVAYLFSSGNRGVGMSDAGAVVFFGTGRPRAGAASAAAGPAPTLGDVWGSNQSGYGQVRPSEVNAGGDGTSVVSDVTWTSWGGPTARGAGTASWVPPDGVSADGVQSPAVITASELGDCHGRPAYRRISWYFPTHGETAATADAGYPDICDG